MQRRIITILSTDLVCLSVYHVEEAKKHVFFYPANMSTYRPVDSPVVAALCLQGESYALKLAVYHANLVCCPRSAFEAAPGIN